MVLGLPSLPRYVLEQAVVSPEVFDNATTTQPEDANTTVHPFELKDNFCEWLLYQDINHSGVGIWDVMILVPNVMFALFLASRFCQAVTKLKQSSSPVFAAFYILVWCVVIVEILRCVVSMTVNAAYSTGETIDKILWLIVRFFLLATEISVITFALAFGHLDRWTSMRRVLIWTFLAALIYSSIQGLLEFTMPSPEFRVAVGDGTYDLFGHGGMLFWMASSAFFGLVYLMICILPFTSCRYHFQLPHKKSFYVYCGLLALLNMVQMLGSATLYDHLWKGSMCVVDVTTYLYFGFFAPLVFFAFLWDFFWMPRLANLLYSSYKSQEDEDVVSLPQSAASATSSTKVPDDRRQASSSGGLLNSTEIDGGDTGLLYDASIGSHSELSIDFDYYDSAHNLNKLPIA